MKNKHKKNSEWKKREQFVEYKMGIKGGEGKSNQSVYDTAYNFLVFVGLCVLFVLVGSLFELIRG